ncbi:hypothetical protein [Larkinella sp.]|uniref:hypothetical protein n=1 Tax=Larkinella sp. TaxID=2034517 RepID=UPI003BAB391C
MSENFYIALHQYNMLKECKGLFGIPDYVIFEEKNDCDFYIVSIELKLKNWQQALTQAFRYLSFSNKSFVVLDEKFIRPALNNINIFEQYNIGLASFNLNHDFKIYLNPVEITPFDPVLNENLTKLITASHAKTGYNKCLSKTLNYF